MTALEILKDALAEKSTDGIKFAIVEMGGGHLEEAERTVRAALIEVYSERKGEEAADAIMDQIGL